MPHAPISLPSTDPVLGIVHRLTDRDRLLLQWLHGHRVLTTVHIAQALFPSVNRAQQRLRELRALGLIDRFNRLRAGGGSYPGHWFLAHKGHQLVAARLGQRPRSPAEIAQRNRQTSESRTLLHTLGVNEFFTALAGFARTHPDAALSRWLPTAACADPDELGWSLAAQPDGYGEYRQYGVQLGFYLEYDRHTESVPTVLGKLDRYRDSIDLGNPPWPVLFVLTHDTRATQLLQQLLHHPRHIPAAVTTTTRLTHLRPADPVWQIPGDPGLYRLIELRRLHDDAVSVRDLPRAAGRRVS